MKAYKKKYSFDKVFVYCRWSHKYPPDDWTVFGVAKWWYDSRKIQYRLCFFGFELRININRKFVEIK